MTAIRRMYVLDQSLTPPALLTDYALPVRKVQGTPVDSRGSDCGGAGRDQCSAA
jgi:hypothetical protein